MLNFLKFNLRTIVSIIIGFVVVALILAVIVSLIRGTGAPFKPTKEAVLGDQTFKIKIAESEQEKEIGLSQTERMPDDYGMIFTFKEDGFYPFWMRDMKFPIDIIFINDNKVVKIFSEVSPPKENEGLRLYVSDKPADTVLEINAGLSEKHNIKEGDSINISDL